MSPRPKCIRKIACGTVPHGFSPAGTVCRHSDGNAEIDSGPLHHGDIGTIVLHCDEYEAIRLCDYEGMKQQEAAAEMGVSRPTLTRIYASARAKMAKALVEQKGISVKGGSAYTAPSWYSCGKCGVRFNNIIPSAAGAIKRCPICHTGDVSELQPAAWSKGQENSNNHIQIMKKIVLPARDGRIDDHFGHCEYYVIYTVDEDGSITEREEMASPQGCGCKSGVAAEFEKKGVTVMLAGNMGAGALNKLTEHGIQVIRGCSGNLEEVLSDYLAGRLKDSGEGCHHHDSEGHSCHGEGHSEGTGHSCHSSGGWHLA